VAVRRAGKLHALCPLALQQSSSWGIPTRKLVSLTNPHTPKFDFVIAADAETTLREVLEFLRREVGWQAMMLSYVPTESSLFPAIRSLRQEGLILAAQYEKMSSPFLRVEGDFDEYYQSLSKKFRQNNGRALRALGKLGPVEFEELRSGPPLERDLGEALEIEASAWQGNNSTAILQDASESHFYRQVAANAAASNQLRLYFIKCGDKRVAFDCCLLYRGVVSGLKNAYDQDYAKYSPGTLLRIWLLEQLAQENVPFTYDMLGTAAPWKLRWTDQVAQLQELVVFPRTLHGRLAFESYTGLSDRLKRLPWLVRLAAAIRKRQ